MSLILILVNYMNFLATVMNNKAQAFRTLLTKDRLKTDKLHNMFNLVTLERLKTACVALDGVLRIEKMILTQVVVKNILINDRVRLAYNLDTIKSAINLKKMNIDSICLN